MQVHNAEKLNVLLFQHNIYDLELGYFEVLERENFCKELLKYLKQLFDIGRRDIINNVIVKVGCCATDEKRASLRAKALQVITDFSQLLNGQKDRELFRLVSDILSGWLRRERTFHSTYAKVCNQIGIIVEKLFSLNLWHQAEPLVAVSRHITAGFQPVDIPLKKEVSKLHRTIADKKAIARLIQSFLESKDHEDAIIGDLLQALTPHSSEAMIQGLFKCSKKNKRLAMLEMITQHREGVLPILIEKLKDRQPWYVVRNSMIILGSSGDEDLYYFARPFLSHPDSRVQREVILCIVNLGGEQVVDRLISSFARINDKVKPLLVNELLSYNHSKVEAILLDVLEQRVCFEPTVREELIEKICSSAKLKYSERAINVLQNIIAEREFHSITCTPSSELAKAQLKRLQN